LFDRDLFGKGLSTFPHHALVRPSASRGLFRKAFVAGFYGFRTIVLQGVPPCSRESILRHGLSHEKALRRCWLLRESVIRDQQNNTS
jgi:hypothetical protein